MDKAQIIEDIARRKVVEQLIRIAALSYATNTFQTPRAFTTTTRV